MKKLIGLFFFIGCLQFVFCQDVIISGVNKNRLLTWSDFTGTPDENSSFAANTYWKLNYSFGGVSFNGDTVKITSFSVGIELDKTKSWIKKGKATEDLLKHEQGHFNIGLICQHDLISQVGSTVFLRSSFEEKLKQIFTEASAKYDAMGIQYDKETEHSKNRDYQEKWDDFFAATLAKLNIIF